MVVHATPRVGQAAAALTLITAGVWAVLADLDNGSQGNLMAEAGLPVPGFLALGGLFAMLVGILVLSLRR